MCLCLLSYFLFTNTPPFAASFFQHFSYATPGIYLNLNWLKCAAQNEVYETTRLKGRQHWIQDSIRRFKFHPKSAHLTPLNRFTLLSSFCSRFCRNFTKQFFHICFFAVFIIRVRFDSCNAELGALCNILYAAFTFLIFEFNFYFILLALTCH